MLTRKSVLVRSFFLRPAITALAILAGSAMLTTTANAVDVTTDPVGFYALTCQSNTDTIVSTPFSRIPEFTGLIASASGSSIAVSNSPGWTAGQWAFLGVALQSNRYYAVVSTGTKEGALYAITNNDASTLSVQLNLEDLSSVSAGDRIKIIPYWTFITGFPDGSVNPSASASTRPTELFIPAFDGTNVNQAPVSTYYFFTNATVRAWRLVGGGATSRNNDILIPDGYSIVRHNVGLTAQTVVVAPGAVPLKKQRTIVFRNAAGGTGRDNYIALFRPAATSLNDSGLAQSGAFRPSASASTRPDELLVVDNNATGINKGPVSTYYYFTNATVSVWRVVGGGATDRGTNLVFQPGFGVVLRVNNIGLPVSATSTQWVNTATY